MVVIHKYKKLKNIKALPLLKLSGYFPKTGAIKCPKKHQYYIVTNVIIPGDAPKDFIKYYHYKKGRKDRPKTWPSYIAKLGHKHYPVESITEYLLNRIGEVLGLIMAKSELGWFGGQIRFLSKYFISNRDEQVLTHGADLYAGYLEDKEFVEDVEKEKQSRDFFTVQFTYDAIKSLFRDNHEEIMRQFIILLIFDALIGNNDRHYYNWGIIKNIKGKEKPSFSPIYDTARGLFWNEHEDKIHTIYNDNKRIDDYIKKYCENSTPKTGWEGAQDINHFELVKYLKDLEFVNNCEVIKNLCEQKTINNVFLMIDTEFKHLLSDQRRGLIKKCLEYRHKKIKEILNFA